MGSEMCIRDSYGRGADMQVLRDAIEKINYPEVDWNHVVERFITAI